jgi:alkylation response protein AidB-like acyl-CoA dehydrogenase
MTKWAGEAELFSRAKYDERGIFHGGREGELKLLRAVGAQNASLGRIFEGHLNGVLLVALFGTDAQRARAIADVQAGRIFGVWNAQAKAPVRMDHSGSGYVLSGAKTWASGAGSVSRPIVTATVPQGGVQMCVVPLDRVKVSIDASGWNPLGMHESDSFVVSFEGAHLSQDDLLGAIGDYERSPWFRGGALRFVAVHTGIVERLFDETVRYLADGNRAPDALQQERIAVMRIGLESAGQWLRSGADAWETFDRNPTPLTAASVDDTVDMARCAVERIALEATELSMRAIGANGLVEPLPFPGLIRDLQMYLRQPAPDAALLRVADTAVSSASALRNSAAANSTA